MDAAKLGWQPMRRARPQGRRLYIPLLTSLLIHALILSLTFSGDEFGLPGLALPWQDRRIEVPDLQVVLAPAPPRETAPALPAAPLPLPSELMATGPAVVSFQRPDSPPEPAAPALTTQSEPTVKANVKPKAATEIAPVTAPAEILANSAPPPKPFPAVIALEQSQAPEFVVPPPPLEPAPPDSAAQASIGQSARERVAEEIARAESARLEVEHQEAARQAAIQKEQAAQDAAKADAARLDAERPEAARQAAIQQELARQEDAKEEAARLDAERQEAARQAAARQDLARQDVAKAEAVRMDAERQESARQAAVRQEQARQEAAKAEVARMDAERQEAARQAAARQDLARQDVAKAEAARLDAERQESARQAAARQEQARQEAARAEAARLDAERQENARQAAGQQEQARQETARAEAARQEAIREQNARRDAARRAMGRQLDEEAARRDAAQAATRLSPSSSGMRRGRLFGRTDANAELILYAEAWSRKIHFNMGFEKVREAAMQPHTDPMVTVAIRSDGSVESVTFVRSSGVPAIDEAIRRIVLDQTPYLPFQPALAREYDVIEIRRTWHFDSAIRLY